MSFIDPSTTEQFFADVASASARATWCALATVHNGEPRVRMVHPTWEGQVLWLATGAGSAKLRQIASTPVVDVQFQVSPPDFVHILARGRAQAITDPTEKKRVWDVMDYDLSMFWKKGPEDPSYIPVRIEPTLVELSKMFGMAERRRWRRETD